MTTDDVLGCAPESLVHIGEAGMSARVPQSQDIAPAPQFVDAERHVVPVSQLPREVREEFKKYMYAEAPLFVKMKKLLRREVEAELKQLTSNP